MFRSALRRVFTPRSVRRVGLASSVLGGSLAAVYALQPTNAHAGFFSSKSKQKAENPLDKKTGWALDDAQNLPRIRDDLPTISLAELSKHYDMETGLWVSYKGAVYDITEFAMGHPGGLGRLLMAGGRDLEPFWEQYRLHFRGHIIGLLEKYRIGNLSAEDAIESRAFEFGNPFEEDPPRHPTCMPATEKPWCGEARIDLLTQSYFTPNELFYTRNHMNVPVVDLDDYVLTVSGEGMQTHTFTVQDLETLFPQYDVVSTIQCAGNRMEDFHGIGNGSTKGTYMSPHWAVGAISNAKWTGVRMRDLLKYCGLDVDGYALGTKHSKDLYHVEFAAMDADETGGNFHASAPFDKVIDPWGDCIVALKMNDRELPRDHGFPVRAIVPGHAGARQPKWLESITVKPTAWPVFQCTSYAPDVTFEEHISSWPPKSKEILENNGWSRTQENDKKVRQQENVVREMPVQSLICQPAQNAVLGGKRRDSITIEGVAWSGGGSGIKRVDVSVDAGESFTATELYKPVEQHPRGQWGWTQFKKDVKLPQNVLDQLEQGQKVELTLTSKALDGHWNVQPERPEPYVNARGVAVNHWYRVHVTLDPAQRASVQTNPAQELTDAGKFGNTPSNGKFHVPFNGAGWDNYVPSPDKQAAANPEFHKVSTAANTALEPGIKETIDWKHYQNITAKPYYWQPPSNKD